MSTTLRIEVPPRATTHIKSRPPSFEDLNPIGPLQDAADALEHFVEIVCPELL